MKDFYSLKPIREVNIDTIHKQEKRRKKEQLGNLPETSLSSAEWGSRFRWVHSGHFMPEIKLDKERRNIQRRLNESLS